jgi:hypothetical protein
MPSEITEFERIVLSCKATGNFMPAWERFVNTRFFVAVIPADSGPKTSDFRFQILKNPQDGKPCIAISEHLDKLSSTQGQKAIQEIGAKLVTMLRPELGILIALSDGAFGLPPELVGWLRSSIQATPAQTPR